MFKRSFQLISFACALAFLAFAQSDAAQTQVNPNSVTINSIKIGTSGTGCTAVETDCIDVQWTTKSPINTAQLLYELSGTVNYESGSSNNSGTAVNNGAATSAKVPFFHSGSGAVKVATIKLKLFQRGLNGAKKQLAESAKTQNF